MKSFAGIVFPSSKIVCESLTTVVLFVAPPDDADIVIFDIDEVALLLLPPWPAAGIIGFACANAALIPPPWLAMNIMDVITAAKTAKITPMLLLFCIIA